MKCLFFAATTLLCSHLGAQVTASSEATNAERHHSQGDSPDQPTNPVLQWNKAVLVIVRTHGAQPPTIHPTRSFAIMHAAIYDAVNAIDRTHETYLAQPTGVSRLASQDAAAAAAAHEILVQLYPAFQTMLDTQLQESLELIPDSDHKTEGINVGKIIADAILVLRSNDGSGDPPIPYVFGSAPGDYQSTPPNFPKQPQFTYWSHVTPFALATADQFRPGPPPALTSDTYSDALNREDQ